MGKVSTKSEEPGKRYRKTVLLGRMSSTLPSRGGGQRNVSFAEEMVSTKVEVRKAKAVFVETVL